MVTNHYCCFRVKNLEKSIDFYTRVLGMKPIKRLDNEELEYSLAWLGYGSKFSDICLELTYNWDNRKYSHGTYFGQLVLGVADVYAATKAAEDNGATVVRPAGPLKGGTMVISFIEDVDGYRIEFVPENLS